MHPDKEYLLRQMIISIVILLELKPVFKKYNPPDPAKGAESFARRITPYSRLLKKSMGIIA